jgi:Uncharacterized protein with protein kinase and helix-hairpin-helix DNA-binding domains
MQQLLKNDQVVQSATNGAPITVKRFLGGGSQGEVYVADFANTQWALKWYFPNYLKTDPHLQARLERAVQEGPPSEKFLWPQDLAFAQGNNSFGYLMALREPRFKNMADLMRGCIDVKFRALASAGFELAHAFHQVHIKGFCYQDINFGNVFFDPDNGDIRVCDNDNVDVNNRHQGAILGTQRFMAPEIVRGEAMPSTQTDLFSLAVLLFHMFMIQHPLEGRREYDIHSFDAAAMSELYGKNPLFIFDPQDRSNEPVPGYHDTVLDYWPIYPTFFQDLFTKAFTEGMNRPEARVVENEWRQSMVRLRDSIMYCQQCRKENFYDQAKVAAGTGGQLCWKCGHTIPFPPRMKIGSSIVVLNHDTQLFPHHLDSARKWDFSLPVAAVVQHPKQADIWGLRNLSDQPWHVTQPDGDLVEVAPQRSVTLARGLKVKFGSTEAEVRT